MLVLRKVWEVMLGYVVRSDWVVLIILIVDVVFEYIVLMGVIVGCLGMDVIVIGRDEFGVCNLLVISG